MRSHSVHLKPDQDTFLTPPDGYRPGILARIRLGGGKVWWSFRLGIDQVRWPDVAWIPGTDRV